MHRRHHQRLLSRNRSLQVASHSPQLVALTLQFTGITRLLPSPTSGFISSASASLLNLFLHFASFHLRAAAFNRYRFPSCRAHWKCSTSPRILSPSFVCLCFLHCAF